MGCFYQLGLTREFTPLFLGLKQFCFVIIYTQARERKCLQFAWLQKSSNRVLVFLYTKFRQECIVSFSQEPIDGILPPAFMGKSRASAECDRMVHRSQSAAGLHGHRRDEHLETSPSWWIHINNANLNSQQD